MRQVAIATVDSDVRGFGWAASSATRAVVYESYFGRDNPHRIPNTSAKWRFKMRAQRAFGVGPTRCASLSVISHGGTGAVDQVHSSITAESITKGAKERDQWQMGTFATTGEWGRRKKGFV